MATAGLDRLLAEAGSLGTGQLPPVEQWNPPFCGDIDIRIARNGTWYHEGRPFVRESLVRLMSSILKREGDDYFLVTPVEKMRIRVDDVPFLAVSMARDTAADGSPVLSFRTLTQDVVTLDAAHPLRVVTDPLTGEPRPYIHVRGNMDARLHRPVFYELVEQAREAVVEGEAHLVIDSAGMTFDLGRL